MIVQKIILLKESLLQFLLNNFKRTIIAYYMEPVLLRTGKQLLLQVLQELEKQHYYCDYWKMDMIILQTIDWHLRFVKIK